MHYLRSTKPIHAALPKRHSFDTTLGADPDGYDDEDRLVYYKRSSQANPQTWTLTAVGDWSSWSNFGTSQSRTHGAAHEILTAGSSPNNAITHDVKGNITEIPTNVSSPARKLFWDFDSRLTGVDTTGDSTPEVTYSYDALGRRVWRTESSATVVYVSAGQQVVCDYPSGAAPSSTPTYRYVWGDYVDEPILRCAGSTYHYYHHNQQFSTIGLTNSSGVVVERYGYTAYGELSLTSGSGGSRSWSTNSNRYLYTGREWDDSVKLFYFRARWYDPVVGRFVGRDPYTYVDGLNAYRSYFAATFLDASGTTCYKCSATISHNARNECDIRGPVENRFKIGPEENDLFVEIEGTCTCCEYRQYVKGFVRRRASYKKDRQRAKFEYPPINGHLPNPLDTFVEDVNSKGIRFGHRNDSNRENDQYTNPDDRKLGCFYSRSDHPGYTFSTKGIDRPIYLDVEIDLTFSFRVYDLCSRVRLQWTTSKTQTTKALRSWILPSIASSARRAMQLIPRRMVSRKSVGWTSRPDR